MDCTLRRCVGVSSASDPGLATAHTIYGRVLAADVCLLL